MSDPLPDATTASVAPAAPGSPSPVGGGRFAALVGAGILLSRLVGLVRTRVFAHYLGSGDAADAFNAAFRIPNFLQNLFGEGVLSASLVPVYARLRAQGAEEDARRLAGAVATLLALVVSVLVLAGVLATPFLIDVIAGGFEGEKREATIRLVRILFPGTGLLVLSAWCLGILNSHRRFFLSYAAPVGWNLAIIAALVLSDPAAAPYDLAEMAAWGAVAGSLLQLGVQVPTTLRLLRGLSPSLGRRSPHVGAVLRNFGPVVMGRGVVQISAYVDTLLASFVAAGGVALLSYAQILYTLPVSLFGMSVSAAELPAMAGTVGAPADVEATLRARLEAGLRRIALFIIPSAVAFLALGDVIAAALFESGRFTRVESLWVWAILAGSSIGLLASTLGRLYASTFYALHDTRTPLRAAIVRVALTVVLGTAAVLRLPALLGVDPRWGLAGLTAASGVAGWVEYVLLRARLARRIGPTQLAAGYLARLTLAAALAAAAGWGVKLTVGGLPPVRLAVLVLGAFGLVYFGVAWLLGVPEVHALYARVAARLRRGRR